MLKGCLLLVRAASVLVSQWTWAATILQSTSVAYLYGISGSFWCSTPLHSFFSSPSCSPLTRSPLQVRCRCHSAGTALHHVTQIRSAWRMSPSTSSLPSPLVVVITLGATVRHRGHQREAKGAQRPHIPRDHQGQVRVGAAMRYAS